MFVDAAHQIDVGAEASNWPWDTVESRVKTSVLVTMPGRARHPSNDNFKVTTWEDTPKAAAIDPSRAPDGSLPNDLRVVFGRSLKAARLKRGLRRSDLADRIGLTAMRLSLIEGGHVDVTFEAATRFGRLVGLEVPRMLDRSEG